MWLKRLIAIINVSLMTCLSFVSAQTTYSPVVRSKNNDCIIEKVQLTNNETIVTIKVPRSKQWGGWVRFSSATVLVSLTHGVSMMQDAQDWVSLISSLLLNMHNYMQMLLDEFEKVEKL